MDERAIEVLDCFLFEDVGNNTNHCEDEWDISYLGNNFLLRNLDTGELHNIKVAFLEGDLSQEDIDTIVEEQEWLD